MNTISIGSILLLCLAIIIGIFFGLAFLSFWLARGKAITANEQRDYNNRIEDRLTRSMHAHEKTAEHMKRMADSSYAMARTLNRKLEPCAKEASEPEKLTHEPV